MRITFFIILFLLVSPLIWGQNYYTRNITMDDGLPSNTIRDIYKDSRGYVWIGTEAGLAKYDGTKFKTYTTRDGLSGNRIWSITEDTLGNLWMANYGNGISMFDGKQFTNYSTKDGLINDNVRIIKYSDKHKGLLIGTIMGFSFFQDSVFTSFTDSIYSFVQVTSFLETDSLIYLLTFGKNDNFIEFNPKNKSFTYLNKDHCFHKIHNRTTISFINKEKDTLIGCYTDGIKIYTKDSLFYNENVGQVFDIVEDKYKNLWLASWTDYGVGTRNDKGGLYKLNNYKEEYYNDKLGIETEQCWCLYYDESENLMWIGTIDKGIYLFPMSGISYKKSKNLNPEKPVINDILIDIDGNAWLTIGNKILRNYKPNDTLCSKYFKQKFASKHPFINTGWEINEFYKINEDFKGNIWVNSNEGFFRYTKDLTQLSYPYIRRQDFEFFFPTKDIITTVVFNYTENYPIQSGIVNKYLYFRKNTTYASTGKHKIINGNIWIINDTNGISLYKKDSLRFFPYIKDQINLNFNAICSDKNNNIIVGTLSGEIYFLKYTNDSLIVEHTIELEHEFHGSKVNWLITNQKNLLFAGTNKGLAVIDLNKQNYDIRFFDRYNGYFDYDSFKAVKDSCGNIYVISNNNITKLDNSFPLLNEKNTKLFIQDIQVNNKTFNWTEVSKTDNWTKLPLSKVKLRHHQSSLIFYFDFLQFKNPNSALFSYKLEGSSMDWIPFTKENKAVFSYLKHGKYIFKLKGYNLSNPSNVVETYFEFQILPPWYKAWWFYLIIAVIIFTSLYLIYKYRVKTIKEKALIQQKISELKLDALKAQMNPHFIFNAFNSLQKYILNQETDNALNYLSDFANLIRKTLDNSSKKEVRLSDEIEYLRSYLELEKLRLENLNYTIEIDEKIDEDYTYLPPMLIQPFVENSILHGIRHLNTKGCIKIRFEEEINTLKVIIEDNGIGRLKSSEINKKNKVIHDSKGTNITQQRLSMLSNNSDKIKVEIQDLIDDKTPLGTRVTLRIPMA